MKIALKYRLYNLLQQASKKFPAYLIESILPRFKMYRLSLFTSIKFQRAEICFPPTFFSRCHRGRVRVVVWQACCPLLMEGEVAYDYQYAAVSLLCPARRNCDP